jgi:type IV pilus assembly protein PilV
MKMKKQGLTLIEVMVAMLVISVGVIAAAGLQTTALKNTSKAQAVNEVTKIAENEISLQRHLDSVDNTCETQPPSGFTCSVIIVPCSIQTGTVTCSSSVVSNVKAYKISVSVADNKQNTISLSTIVASKEFAGQIATP